MDELDLRAIRNELRKPELTTGECCQAVEALLEALARLQRDNVAAILQKYYDRQVYFKDPFHETRGLPQLIQIWQAHFRRYPDSQLRFHLHACHDDTAYVEWRMIYTEKDTPIQRNGLSKLLLNGEGKVRVQMDYWDSGEHYYQRLPLIGGLLRWLAGRQRG